MLNVFIEKKGAGLLMKLQGSVLDTGCLFTALAPEAENFVGISVLRVDCREIARFNSAGTRAWMRYFQRIADLQIHVVLHDCSPATMDQINFFSNFTPGAEIESICLPFACVECARELQATIQLSKIFSGRAEKTASEISQISSQTCPHCGGNAEFDDNPAVYFSFLNRSTEPQLVPLANAA